MQRALGCVSETPRRAAELGFNPVSATLAESLHQPFDCESVARCRLIHVYSTSTASPSSQSSDVRF